MARIRSVHPGIATDEAYMLMTAYAKAAWPLLWTECDDSGVFEWKPVVLKARLLPADNIDFSAILDEYIKLGVVKAFEVSGRAYGAIRNFQRFQRPKKPNPIHPLPEAVAPFVTGGSPPVPHQFPTSGENIPQMEDEGDKRETTPSGVVPRDPLGGRLPELLEALGITDETKTPGLLVISEPIRWVEGGCDIDLDIIPTLRSFRARGRPIRGWGYCSEAVFETRDRRLAPVPAVQPRHATGPPSAHPRKQTVGQQARDQLKHLEGFNATDNQTGYHDASDENAGFAGSGIARRIAIAASR